MARRFSRSDLEEMLHALGARDADLAHAHRVAGTPDLGQRAPGFATLLHIIIAQQLSTASAGAIRKRLDTLAGAVTPERFLAFDDEALREIGFSRQKTLYTRLLAESLARRHFDLFLFYVSGA